MIQKKQTMKRILFFAILFFPLLAFSQTRQDSVGVKTISSLTELTANIDTSYEVIFHDPSTGKISYRASVGEFLKTINALPSVIGTSQIINATIINEDISGSAAIALSKLQNLTANRLVGRDTTGTGIPESLTVGYGLRMGTDRIDIDTVSASGLVSKSRLTNALDDVGGGGGNASGRAVQVLTADGTDTLDFGGTSYATDYWQLDLSSVTSCSLYFTNPNTSIVPTYNIHFENASTDTVVFVSTFQDANGDVITSYVFEQGQIVPMYYENSLYHTNYLSISGTNTAASISYTNNSQTTVQGALDSLFSVTSATITKGAPPDNTGTEGSLRYDDTNFYVKTAAGWYSIAMTVYSPLVLSYESDIILEVLANSSIVQSGGVASQWGDISGNSYNFSQGITANMPTIDASGNLVFDGVNDYMSNDSNVFSNASVVDSAFTIFLVSEVNGSHGRQKIMEFNWGSGADTTSFRIQADTIGAGGTFSLEIHVDDDGVNDFNYVDTISNDVTFLTCVAASETTSTDVRVNNSQVFTENNDGSWNSAFPESNHIFTLGSNTQKDSHFLDGKIKMIVMYKRKLSPSEINTVAGEINSYFSIY